MADADELASVRKELQSVKTRAVGKIKALQAEVDQLKFERQHQHLKLEA